MKLKKREITLNEADSVKDVYFLERTLKNAYEEGDAFSFRKETVNELSALKALAASEAEKMQALWKKAKKEQL